MSKTSLLQFKLGTLLRAALLLLVLAVGLGSGPQAARASHIRAGDIQARVDTTVGPGFNPRRVFFKMVLYVVEGPNVVDEDKVTIFFGDGTSSRYRGIDRIPGGAAPCRALPIPARTSTYSSTSFPRPAALR
ncbi:hypothetical protein ACFQT0_21720 [Hymenobacter humi]|uniref:Uncharacterized protein n=1 Tax=Hymenobacter humi TaxID=1411620 RepID=A0ABW2UA22_9BACT